MRGEGCGYLGARCHGSAGADRIIAVFHAHGYSSQPVRACIVFGKDHVETAFMHALRAVERGEGASDSLMTETLLYLGCHRQLSKSLSIAGIGSEPEIVIVTSPPLKAGDAEAILGELDMTRDDELVDLQEWKMKYAPLLGIHTADLRVAAEWVLERVALVDVER